MALVMLDPQLGPRRPIPDSVTFEWVPEGVAGDAGCKVARWRFDGTPAGVAAVPGCTPTTDLFPAGRPLFLDRNEKTVVVRRPGEPRPLCTIDPFTLLKHRAPPGCEMGYGTTPGEVSADGAAFFVNANESTMCGQHSSIRSVLTRYDTATCKPAWSPVEVPAEWVLSADGEVHTTDGVVTRDGKLLLAHTEGGLQHGEIAGAYLSWDGGPGAAVRTAGEWRPLDGPSSAGVTTIAASGDGRFAVGTRGKGDEQEVVVWDVASGKMRARAPAHEAGAEALVIDSVAVVRDGAFAILSRRSDVTWIAMDDGAELHATFYAPARAGDAMRVLFESSDGRIDGDSDLLAAAAYRTAAGPVPVARVAEQFGYEPRTQGLVPAWLARHAAAPADARPAPAASPAVSTGTRPPP
jgi:hypothetical protein